MTRRCIAWKVLLALALGSGTAIGQTPPSRVIREPSSLGPPPGEGSQVQSAPGGTEGSLGGRLGPSSTRAPAYITRPGTSPFGLPTPPTISPIAEAPQAELPLYGALAIPTAEGEEGPPNGLTLDLAIERLVHDNLDLRSKFLEIPQAQADVLTASLRANPLFYADSQLIPYQTYSNARPGGPVQYDINITYPFDLSHKRRFRTEVACRAKRVLEAQYQDAVRQQINNLYTAYVDVLAARETIRYAKASIEGLDRLHNLTQSLRKFGQKTIADVNRVQIQRDAAEVGLAEAEAALLEAKRALIPLLNLRPGEVSSLELRGSIYDRWGPPPPEEELVLLALNTRPDLVAFRLGIQRAEADVRLAHAERYQDVYVLAQPYTFQDNSPFNRKSAHSFAVGVTVPLPIYNRNQGNIQRARVNVVQTRNELAALEQQVATEMEQAAKRYNVTLTSVRRIEHDLLPLAVRVRDDALKLYRGGEADLIVYLNAQREYNDLVRQYRDTVIRHRRSMLDLNTAAGQRILP
jgi:outer membrane protein, heavy metal efflux system